MPANLKELHCGYVSASESGDYFQVLFGRTRDSDEGYLLVQRQFELSDGGKCYVETDDLDFTGHFRLRNARLTRSQFEFEFGNRQTRKMKVSFTATDSAYGDVKRTLQIVIPDLDILIKPTSF
jgi:hypothetical protein